MEEITFVLFKPDAVSRGVWPDIIAIYLSVGLRVIQFKVIAGLTEELVREHYFEHRERPFFGEMVEFMCSGPVIAIILKGDDAIQRVRQLNGPTGHAGPETIRGRFGQGNFMNAVHASDSPESVKREIARFLGGQD